MSITETNTSKTAERSRAWIAARTNTLVSLRQKFPKAFADKRRPLKIGIHLDIQAAAPDLDPIEVSRALRYYVGDLRYHRACREGADRIDFDGNAAGTVTADEAANAARSVAGIEARLAQRRERRAAEAKPAPPPIPEKPKALSFADLKVAAQRRLQGA